MVGPERRQPLVDREGGQKQEERLLEVLSVTRSPGKLIRDPVTQPHTRTEAARRDIAVVVKPPAQRQVQPRRNVPRRLQVSAGLIGPQPLCQEKRVRVRRRRIRIVAPERRGRVVAQVEHLETPARLHLADQARKRRVIVLQRRLPFPRIVPEHHRARPIRSSTEMPGGYGPPLTRSFTCCVVLASECVKPNNPTPLSPNSRCQLKPLALRQP